MSADVPIIADKINKRASLLRWLEFVGGRRLGRRHGGDALDKEDGLVERRKPRSCAATCNKSGYGGEVRWGEVQYLYISERRLRW